MAVLSSLFGRREVAPAVGAQMISATELPPELRPYYKDILSKAQALYQDKTAEGYKPYTGPTLAEFTPEQQQVQTGIAGLVGSGAPVYQEAMGMTREAATPFTATQIEEYMSPYQQAVTDIEKREAQKQYESQVLPELAAKAAQAQAFGGSRQAILEGMAADTQQRLLADIQAKGSAQAYQDAIERLDADRLAKGQAATQLANLQGSQFKQATTELSGLQAIGQEKQKQAQTALNEAFQQYLDEQQFPYDTMSKYQSVVTGAPIRPMQYVPPQQAQYEPSLGQQLIGGLGGLGNIYGAFTGKTIGGQPYQQPAKTGGGIGTLIKRANGGGDLSVDESLLEPFEDAPASGNIAPMVNKYLSSLGKVEEAFARSRKSQLENEKLAKQQVDYQKSLLEADKANQQFNREQAAFAAMAGLLEDQDVTDAPGGGVGQVLTMLAKAGPKIGESEKEQRAKLRESQKNLIDLEMQYNKALADGDMNLAMQLSEVMKGGAAVEIDIGTLNATLAKNNLDNTFEMLKLAKVSEPVQKSILTHASNLLGYDAIYDPSTDRLKVNAKGEPLNPEQQKQLAKVDAMLQNIYYNVMSESGNQAKAMAAVKNYTLAEDIQLPKTDIVIPDIDNTINQSILDNLNLTPGQVKID
tara:strand:- start:4072 stop:5988 length:1917 start_codon:yes stop_codon:yes gene_type:complete